MKKVCIKCGEEKALSEFSRNHSGQHRRRLQCKTCRNAYCRSWRDKNRERYCAVNAKYQTGHRADCRTNNRKWHRGTGRASVLLRSARRRAERAGVPFTLTKVWLEKRLAAGQCEVTGIFFQSASFGVSPYSPSVDRIKPALGYTPENCRLVLFALNTALGNWGLVKFLPIARALVEEHG